jgi:hypothetical protein
MLAYADPSICCSPPEQPLRDYLDGLADAASLPQIADVVPAYTDNKRAAEQADLEPAAKRAKPAGEENWQLKQLNSTNSCIPICGPV